MNSRRHANPLLFPSLQHNNLIRLPTLLPPRAHKPSQHPYHAAASSFKVPKRSRSGHTSKPLGRLRNVSRCGPHKGPQHPSPQRASPKDVRPPASVGQADRVTAGTNASPPPIPHPLPGARTPTLTPTSTTDPNAPITRNLQTSIGGMENAFSLVHPPQRFFCIHGNMSPTHERTSRHSTAHPARHKNERFRCHFFDSRIRYLSPTPFPNLALASPTRSRYSAAKCLRRSRLLYRDTRASFRFFVPQFRFFVQKSPIKGSRHGEPSIPSTLLSPSITQRRLRRHYTPCSVSFLQSQMHARLPANGGPRREHGCYLLRQQVSQSFVHSSIHLLGTNRNSEGRVGHGVGHEEALRRVKPSLIFHMMLSVNKPL